MTDVTQIQTHALIHVKYTIINNSTKQGYMRKECEAATAFHLHKTINMPEDLYKMIINSCTSTRRGHTTLQ